MIEEHLLDQFMSVCFSRFPSEARNQHDSASLSYSVVTMAALVTTGKHCYAMTTKFIVEHALTRMGTEVIVGT